MLKRSSINEREYFTQFSYIFGWYREEYISCSISDCLMRVGRCSEYDPVSGVQPNRELRHKAQVSRCRVAASEV